MNISRGRIGGAKKIVIYGSEGIGKSTLASHFPDPLFIDTEGSTKNLDVARFDPPKDWKELLSQVRYVFDNPGICKTLVVDTADWAEKLEIDYLCSDKGWDGLEGAGYGKGYTYSAEEFGRLLTLLESIVSTRNIHVVLTGHAQMKKIELPEEMGAYDHWEMKLSKKVAPMVKEWADMVLFCNYKVRVIEVEKKKKAQGGQRIMYTCHTPYWDAKNRYGLPEELPMEYQAIREVIKGNPKQEPVKAEGEPKEEPKEPKEPKKPKKAKKDELKTEVKEPAPVVLPEKDDSGIDEGIMKELRDLMIRDDISEMALQCIVNERQPGLYTDDTPIRNYDPAFVRGWIIKFWSNIVDYHKKMMADMPFH